MPQVENKGSASQVEITRPDGGRIAAWLAEPGGPALGSVVVIHEWWGLNDQTRGICARLASAGYRALAPDLFRGEVAQLSEGARASGLAAALDFGAAVSQDLHGALTQLTKTAGGFGEMKKVATMGFCMGGALSVLSGLMIPHVDAVVAFYGIPPAERADAATLKCPFLGHFARHDDWCSPERVGPFEDRLRAGGVEYELYWYDAKHAFFNEQRPEVFDEPSARTAWDRSLAFLKKHVG